MLEWGKEMEIHGWNYCYENLPYWEIRYHFPYVCDQFTQNPLGEYAILIYSIAEISMCNEVGCLAVFENKEHPFLVLNAYKVHFPPQTPIFSEDGRYACLKSQMYLSEPKRTICPLLLLDLHAHQFTMLENKYNHITIQNQTGKESNLHLNLCSDTSEAAQQVFIHIAELVWYPFREINMTEHWCK